MRPAPPPAAVIFDCDGVVMQRNPMPLDPLAAKLQQQGITLSRAELRNLLGGRNAQSFVRRVTAKGADLPETWLYREYARIIHGLASAARPMPGIQQVLQRLDQAGIRYAMASNGPLMKMELSLAGYPVLFQRFRNRMFSARSLQAMKPAPTLFLHAAQMLRVAPRRCVVVDDGLLGVTGAVAAGMCGLCFTGGSEGAFLAEHAAELADYNIRLFHRLQDLPLLLGL